MADRPFIDEAYAAKAMPDLGLEIEDFQAQTWRIERWSQQPKRIVGPEFSCGGHKWCGFLPKMIICIAHRAAS